MGHRGSWLKVALIKDGQSALDPRLNKQKLTNSTLQRNPSNKITFRRCDHSDDGQFLKGTQFDRWDIEVMDQSCP